MDMKAVVDFLQNFIQQDHETRLAFYTEDDDAAFQQTLRRVEQFYALEEGVYSGLGRSGKMDETWYEMREEMRQQVMPRVLFQVKKYAHTESGEVYRAYLSGGFDFSQDGYNQILSLAQTKAGLRIVSVDGHCLSCAGRGKIGEEQCPACGGTGWEHGSGRKLGDLGRLVETYKLQAPTDPTSLADYGSA